MLIACIVAEKKYLLEKKLGCIFSMMLVLQQLDLKEKEKKKGSTEVRTRVAGVRAQKIDR